MPSSTFAEGELAATVGQRLPQCHLRILRQRGHSLLPNGRIVLRGLGVLRLAELNEKPQQALQICFFEFRNRSGASARRAGDVASAKYAARSASASANESRPYTGTAAYSASAAGATESCS